MKIIDFNSYRESKQIKHQKEVSTNQDKKLSLFINSVIPFMNEDDQRRLANHKEESDEFMYIISEIMMKAAEHRVMQG